MDINKVLMLRSNKEDEKIKLNKILWKIKPIEKALTKRGYEYLDFVPVETLEKFVQQMNIKHGYRIQWISSYYEKDENNKVKMFVFYTVSVVRPDNTWLTSVNGITMWELMAKISIVFYDDLMKERKRKNG